MSPAPRFSTADIAKGAQPTEETTPIERIDPIARVDPADAVPEDTAVALFAADAAADFQRRWDGIQASFVDDPRHAVEEADSLVAETMQRLADSFAKERQRLEQQLDLDRALPDLLTSETTATAATAAGSELRSPAAQAAAEARAAESPNSAPHVSTEDLRIALRHYRSFFKRLLSV